MNSNLQFTAHDNHLYAYADETLYIAETPEECSLIGYGIFITPEKEINWLPNHDDRICRGEHPPKTYKDCRPENYFHATDDCPAVRSQVIKAINMHACGIFIFCYKSINGKPEDEDKIDIWNKLLTFLYNTGTITSFFVEKRNDIVDDDIAKIDKMFDDMFLTLKDGLLYTSPDQEPKPLICKPLHKINHTRVKNKGCPGITVVDYLAWACQQKIRKHGADRAKLGQVLDSMSNHPAFFDKFEWTNNNVTCDAHSIFNGTGILSRCLGNYNKNIRYCYPFNHCTTSYDDYRTKSYDSLLKSYLEIEDVVNNIIIYDPIILRHLSDDYNKYREYKKTNNHYNIIMQACRIFLWSCDTLPIWCDFDKSDIPRWHVFLQLKYVALYLCKEGMIRFHLSRNLATIKK